MSCTQIIPWLSYSVPGATNLLVLTLNSLSALSCYLSCVLGDAGSVPEGFTPDAEKQGSIEVKRKVGSVSCLHPTLLKTAPESRTAV